MKLEILKLLGHSTRLLKNSILTAIRFENNKIDNRGDGKVTRNLAKLNN